MLPLERPAIGFNIPGKPFGKQRPRFSRATGRTFTPAETVAFERTVSEIGLRHFAKPFEGPVRLTIVATFVPAESWSQKKRAAHLGLPHTQKPDIDNVGKSIADGLNRVAWADDSQIAELLIRKRWGEHAGIFVKVEGLWCLST